MCSGELHSITLIGTTLLPSRFITCPSCRRYPAATAPSKAQVCLARKEVVLLGGEWRAD